MDSIDQKLLRRIPPVDAILEDAALARLWTSAGVPRRVVVDCVRSAVGQTRTLLAAGSAGEHDEESLRRSIVALALKLADEAAGPHYRKVINATGIILHTALGRAVLPERAVRQIVEQLSGYSLLQADVESGARSRRDARIEWLLQQLTGAEAATVVNNNAAATAIVLNTVAAGREVIVSRGQLVEIGGSFRLPEVMAASGAKLVEVGMTNRTHAKDYQRAITDQTAAILRVHPSNYKISGFTSEVPLEELIRIAHAHSLVLIDDVGAGALVDFSRYGFTEQPTLPDSVRAGSDLITSSGDKLIGGPQGGIILGRAPLVEAVRKNPMARMLRVDKLTLAAMEATLWLFLDAEAALDAVPTLRMIRRGLDELNEQAVRIAAAVSQRAKGARASCIDGSSQMGSGSLPTENIPTRLVAVESANFEPGELAARLRRGRPPVFARVHKGQLLVDPRTLLEGEEGPLVCALVAALEPATE
jgi:L-seryl-tRNA(Ser) seleniumtransferase